MEALLLLLLFLFSAVLIALTKFTENGELFIILAGILFVIISLPLNMEGITFDIATSKTSLQTWVYNPITLTPTNSSTSVTYTNTTQKDIYTDGLSALFFLLGMYTTGTGGLMFLEKRKNVQNEEESF